MPVFGGCGSAVSFMGTSNNDGFFVGSIAGVAHR
jgi:hypothetical protein